MTRTLLPAGVMLLMLLLAAAGLQLWLRAQTIRLDREATTAAADTVLLAATLAPRQPGAWDAAYCARLGALVNGTVALTPPGGVDRSAAGLRRPLPGHAGWFVQVELAQSPVVVQLQLIQHRALTVTLLLGLAVALVPACVALLGSRRQPGEGTRSPWNRARAEGAGLEQFARLTVERGVALEREHDARRRAEEDLQVSRTALDHSLDERIRLGRELHDNMSQTLYAVGLTLESVRRKMTAAPEIERRLDQCMLELRRLNQEVRAHIRALDPGAVRGEPLSVALAVALRGSAPEGVTLEQRLDESALAQVPPAHVPEIVNLVREAVSNSVRHGHASRITLRAAHDTGRVALSVLDDGTGFQTESVRPGHGLDNMRARAAALGAELQIESAPGKGTRVLLLYPIPART